MSRNETIAREVKRILMAGALLTGIGTPLYAQDEPLETIVVTGSHIARTDEGALPVQIITKEQIEQTGATSAEQFLKTVSAAVQGNSNSVAATTSGANAGGVSSVSLRGLGSQRTLVLVNGRRLSGGGTITDSVSVDVNSIPLAAIERVEVLKDGASAVYGSDAIAGVINFIIRDDYEGATVGLYGGGTSDGGGIKRANAAIGYGNLQDNRYNVMFAAGFQKEDSLFGRDRSFSNTALDVANFNDTTSGNTFPANILIPDTANGEVALPGAGGPAGNPFAGNCGSGTSIGSPFRDPNTCRFDTASLVSLFPDAERASAFGAAHYALTDAVQLYAEASYSHNKQRFVIQPTPLSDQFNLPPGHPLFNQAPYNRGVGLGEAASPFAFTTIVLKPSSPFYPTATVQAATGGPTPDILVRYRAVENGNRDWTDTAEQPRGVVGIKGKVADWNFDGSYLYAQTKLTEHFNNGGVEYSKILPLLNSGQVNFFGANTPDIQAQLRATNFVGDTYSTQTSISGFSATASRDLVKLPAGPLALALGAEWRQEKFSVDPSQELQLGDLAHYGGNVLPMSQSRDASALLAELSIPVVKGLDTDLAVRYDDYQRVGSKTTPKASVRWRPVQELMLRAAYGKGFRAPSLTELFTPTTTGVSAPGLDDPKRCKITQNSNDCGTQFNVLLGGTPNLKPETSTDYTLGLIFEPNNTASIGFDFFRVNLKNPIIFGIDPGAMLADEARFSQFITRGAPTADCPGCPGPIQQIDQHNLNLGATHVRGVDVDWRLRVPTEGAGTFTWGLIGTYFSTYETQTLDGAFLSIVGRVSPIVQGAGGVIPRWHHYMTLGWSLGVWEATVSQNFQSSYADVAGNSDPSVGEDFFRPRQVGKYQTFDAQVAFSGIEHLKIGVGVKNAFDEDPPYTNAGGQNFFQSGYDPGYADPRGRFYYGTLTYSFK